MDWLNNNNRKVLVCILLSLFLPKTARNLLLHFSTSFALGGVAERGTNSFSFPSSSMPGATRSAGRSNNYIVKTHDEMRSKSKDGELEALLNALIKTESNGNPLAIGRDGELGALQIRKILVDDVNRILQRPEFVYSDRYSVERSKQMARIYLGYYCRNMTNEQMARCWNGGPEGYKKEYTEKYWRKIKKCFH